MKTLPFALLAVCLVACSQDPVQQSDDVVPVDCPQAVSEIALPSRCWETPDCQGSLDAEPWASCARRYMCSIHDAVNDVDVDECVMATDCSCLEAAETCGEQVAWDKYAPVCKHASS